MPLKKGRAARTRQGQSANIRTLHREGRPLKQAIAISMRLAGKSNPKKSSRSKKG
jgi:hypothetical protein